MKRRFLIYTLSSVLAATLPMGVSGEEEAAGEERLPQKELLHQFRQLSPAERQVLIREFHQDQRLLPRRQRPEAREGRDSLSPEEHRARLQELRERELREREARLHALEELRRRSADSPTVRPERLKEVREQLEALTPEERQSFLQDLRRRQAPPTLAPAVREELRALPPEERRARLQELRQQAQTTPREHDPRLRDLRQRSENRLNELRQKKADDTLSGHEQQQLQQLEGLLQRLERDGVRPPGPSRRPAPLRLDPDEH